MEGNQILAARSPVLVLDSLEPPVPRPIKLEGAGFCLYGRVAIVARGGGRVHAVVRAGRPHDVFISAHAGGITASCDCVTFREQPQVCRHLWAALIEVQNDRLLDDPPARAAVP